MRLGQQLRESDNGDEERLEKEAPRSDRPAGGLASGIDFFACGEQGFCASIFFCTVDGWLG
jgi:hypothetical protein